MHDRKFLRLGTRGSLLARWQADWCAEQLRQQGIDVEIVVIKTDGDLVQDRAIANIGAQGIFTRQIQLALLKGEIDLAVHSLKDLPTEPVSGLILGGVPKRGPCRDVFLGRDCKRITDLPPRSRIGTESMRRKAQLLHRFGDTVVPEDIRGNIETRIQKMDQGHYDALILAEAGLVRLGLSDHIGSYLEPPDFLPAVGQGALGLEIRTTDTQTGQWIDLISDSESFYAVLAERAMLSALQGGCRTPIAALATVREGTLSLHGRVLSPDGRIMIESVREAPLTEAPYLLGIALAQDLLDRGAMTILEEIRGSIDPRLTHHFR